MNHEAELWKAFKNGDRTAYEQLFDSYYSPMYQYGRRILPDTELLKDCIQDVFLKIWQSKENLADVISIQAYLFRALKVRLIKAQEKALKKTSVFEKEPAEVSHESLLITWQEDEATTIRLQHLIGQLTKRQQEAIHLRFYQQMSYEEISEVMQVSNQGIRNLIYHAIKFLRENMLIMLLWLACP
jgi:RNA polymerase sigma factor (sigma-70 family)